VSGDGGTLAALLEAAATDLDGVERHDTADGIELRRGGRHFATISDPAASFRLDRMVAAAALRTPDTAVSALGPDWVTFRPASVDGYAADRATAWLELAWRRVGPTD
jgi:hypothetical protein